MTNWKERFSKELRGDFSEIDMHIFESRVKMVAVVLFVVYTWYVFG
jgi:hypothetical protein